jgi:hypothetical protein
MYEAPWTGLSALFDPGWVDRMRDSIAVSDFSPEAAIITGVFFGGAAIFVALAFFLKSVSKDEPHLAPLSWITEAEKVREIFLLALRRRSKIRLTFSREVAASAHTDAALAEVYSDSLALELSAATRANRGWIGKLVECDFRLRQDPATQQWSFYNFVAEIKDVRVVPEQYAQIIVAMPSRLEMEQKRAFLRVEPQRTDVRELDIWPENHVRSDPRRPDDPQSWGRAHLSLTEATAPDIAVEDISGGGVRLFLRGEALRTGHVMLTPGLRVYLSLRLSDPREPDGSVLFRLSCQVQNVYASDTPDGGKAFGLRFVAHGAPVPDAPGRLEWRPPQSGGVPAVDEWAYAKHLDLYRSRGR